MRKSVLAFILSLCFVLHAMSQETINATIMHDSLERSYILYVPEKYTGDEEVPLVFNFHGYTSAADQQMFYGDFRPLADQHNFIVVHPQGTIDEYGNPFFNADWGAEVDDIGFAIALIDELAANYNINQNRIYSTGMSNGGFMSYTLACHQADRFAAIASVTGTMTIFQVGGQCVPSREVPVMEIHGTQDETVPYEGNDFFSGTEEVIRFWVTHNQCDAMPEVNEFPDLNMDDGSTVTHSVYSNGTNDSSVELLTVNDGGHTWPGTVFVFGSTNADFNASTEIWRFFSQFDLNGMISSTEELTSEEAFTIAPNPVSESIEIQVSESLSNDFQVMILDGQGRIILTDSNTKSVNTSLLTQGIYTISVLDGKDVYSQRFVKI